MGSATNTNGCPRLAGYSSSSEIFNPTQFASTPVCGSNLMLVRVSVATFDVAD